MSSEKMSSEAAIKYHLTSLSDTYFSAFMAGIRDARKFTGRDQGTGEKLTDLGCGDRGSWLGTIGYLALLDQIGSSLKPKDRPTLRGPSIQQALKYFTSLSDEEIDALYALRNAFAHEFGLTNDTNSEYYHHFKVTQGADTALVNLPSERWDGDLMHKSQDTCTIINLEKLGDLVEEIYHALLSASESGALEATCKGGSDGLVARYSFCYTT